MEERVYYQWYQRAMVTHAVFHQHVYTASRNFTLLCNTCQARAAHTASHSGSCKHNPVLTQ
jgi:hypothetical protein